MPSVPAVGPDAEEERIPVLNSGDLNIVEAPDDQEDCDAEEFSATSSPRHYDTEDEFEDFPREEGCHYDDPLWYGKTIEEIRFATESEKSRGNAASREGDWKSATRCWKNALKGSEKLKDRDTEVRLRLNLALGYTRQDKAAKALEQCKELLRARLDSALPPELRAKTHFRRAEAHEVAGEESKAVASLRSALEIEPGNAEVRRKLAAIKRVAVERQERERELFRGKLPAALSSKEPRSDASSMAPRPTPETDRVAAARLAARCTGGVPAEKEEDRVDLPGLNMEVGPALELFGPLRPDAEDAEAPAPG
mmetsp:Transcript_15365/g.35959  ORF Transcript_15365/g.35959 Transcript_15365/m.35959 type:complete len:309 (+) Transcript_15365:75-1001(+)